MISPEIIRRYPFFAGLENAHVLALAQAGDSQTLDTGQYFFQENQELSHFYLLLEGAVSIVIQVPDRSVDQAVSGQLTGSLVMTDLTISTVGTGNVFGWPGLVPPHVATAGAKAIMPCRVVAFDCKALRAAFVNDPGFGFKMMEKAAQMVAERLRDLRMENLATLA